MNVLRKDEKGQGMVEYGLILALLSVVAFGALGGVGGKVSSTFGSVKQTLDGGIYSDGDINRLVKDEGYVPIASADELNSIRKGGKQTFGTGSSWEDEYTSGEDKKYIQVSNIDLSAYKSNVGWLPIGNESYPFTGEFDGGGYTIDSLEINRGLNNDIGLFGYVNGSVLSNIKLINVDVAGNNHVGSLVGQQRGASSVVNSLSEGIVSGKSYIGGLAGYQGYSSEVIDSHSLVDVVGSGLYVGGLIGHQYIAKISDSSSHGEVKGAGSVGGLIGSQQNNSSVLNSYSQSHVVSGGDNVGGLIGRNWKSKVKNSYTTGNVVGDSRVGGLIGWSFDGSTIKDTYSNGFVTGKNEYGGLVGYYNSSSIINNSYYNISIFDDYHSKDGFGLPIEEMKSPSTYDSWDQSIWNIREGSYPTLQWQN